MNKTHKTAIRLPPSGNPPPASGLYFWFFVCAPPYGNVKTPQLPPACIACREETIKVTGKPNFRAFLAYPFSAEEHDPEAVPAVKWAKIFTQPMASMTASLTTTIAFRSYLCVQHPFSTNNHAYRSFCGFPIKLLRHMARLLRAWATIWNPGKPLGKLSEKIPFMVSGCGQERSDYPGSSLWRNTTS